MSSDDQSKLLTIMAAGSLRAVFVGIIGEFERFSGLSVRIEHGPAGLLREKIEQGAGFDVFASANMAHPRRLQQLGLAGPVKCFARNRLSVISRRDLGMTEENLLDILLDPQVKLGTSTPEADPSGDYALEFFDKVETLFPGKGRLLSGKARRLVGGRVPLVVPAEYSAAGWLIDQGLADAFISYASNGQMSREDDRLQVVAIPEALGPIAEYGMTLSLKENAANTLFRDHVLSPSSQAEFKHRGFICL